jgi:Aspartyl protease
MRRISIVAALTALSFSSTIALALEGRDEVPFKLYRGYVIVVRGSIGGLKNLNLVVDTGAIPGVLDARIARRLHLQGRPERVDLPIKTLATERVTVPNVEVGPTHVDELSMIVQDLSFAEEALGTRVDGMIGFDVLGQFPFTIDYESRKLVFGPVDPSFVIAPYSPDLPYAIVLLHVQQETLGILVDTGASNLVLFQRGVRNCRSAINTVGRETWVSMGGDMPVAKAQLIDAYLGGMPWGQRVAYITENSTNQPIGLAGLLGTAALGKRVGFDPIRKVVAWEAK